MRAGSSARLAERYRGWVEHLLEQLDDPEQRLEAMLMLCALIERVVLTPATKGRGCDVRLEGRLTTLLAAATGQAPTMPPMFSMERVKGIEPSS